MVDDGSLLYRPLLLPPMQISKEPLAPRHRRKRKDEEVVSSTAQFTQTQTSRGAQFDLEDSAFPPLPGKCVVFPMVTIIINLLVWNLQNIQLKSPPNNRQ